MLTGLVASEQGKAGNDPPRTSNLFDIASDLEEERTHAAPGATEASFEGAGRPFFFLVFLDKPASGLARDTVGVEFELSPLCHLPSFAIPILDPFDSLSKRAWAEVDP